MDEPQPPPSMAALDRPVSLLGFQYEHISPDKLIGRLRVTDRCCQPFQVLHGGVSALVAESMASMGAYLSSGFGRIAGAQLSISHLRPAALGDTVVAEATPLHAGKTIQVWEVKLWKEGSSATSDRTLISTSKVTLVCGRQLQGKGTHYEQMIKRVAKL